MTIDFALYYLEHHNKNLTKQQEECIATIREYREGKYGFKDLANIANNNGLDGAVSYLECHGTKVYSKETLITFINAIYGALFEEYFDWFDYSGNAKESFAKSLNQQLSLLEIDFDGKEGRK